MGCIDRIEPFGVRHSFTPYKGDTDLRWSRNLRTVHLPLGHTKLESADSISGSRSNCLQLNVSPVFVPPLEHGMQNAIESTVKNAGRNATRARAMDR